MREAHPEMVTIGCDEDLRLVPQASKGDRMDDAIAIALEGIARPSRSAIVLDEGPAARFRRVRGKGRWEGHLLAIFSILIWAGVRVQLKPSTPSLASLFTND